MALSRLLSSDESLRAAILDLFAADARTAAADLRVGVLNGIAHLAGTVHSLEVRDALFAQQVWRGELGIAILPGPA